MRKNFSENEIDTLRAQFSGINTVNTDRLNDFYRIFSGCDNDAIRQLATANIKFVSSLARNEQRRRGF